MALNETNCESRDITFKITDDHSKNYSFIWSTKDEAKSKGSGVALIFHKTWAKYYRGHTIFSPYLIQAKFLFYGNKFVIWPIIFHSTIKKSQTLLALKLTPRQIITHHQTSN